MKQRYEKTKQQILKILPYKMRMYFERNVERKRERKESRCRPEDL